MKNYYNFYMVALNSTEVNNRSREIKKIPTIINLDNSMLNEADDRILTNLAYIDKLTSGIDEDKFRRHLLKIGKISYYDTPIFIVRTYNYSVKENNEIVQKKGLKFYSPIFKSKNSDLIDNLAITTLRQRVLTLGESSYLLRYFCKLYNSNDNFRTIAEDILNVHDLEHVLNYENSVKNEKNSPIKYNLLRELVSTIYEFEKYKYYELYLENVYGRYYYIDDILKILPKKIVIKKTDYDPVVRMTKEDTDKIKNEPWDNKAAKDQYKGGPIDEKYHYTLTLEDQLRAGVINWNNYVDDKMKRENKFRK